MYHKVKILFATRLQHSQKSVVNSIPRTKNKSEIGQSAFKFRPMHMMSVGHSQSEICLHVIKCCASPERHVSNASIGQNG